MRAIAVFLFSASLWAGTQVSDTVKDAGGRPANGSVTFTPSVTWQGVSNWVARTPITARIVNGVFTVTLEATDTDAAIAAGAYYNVTWQPSSISPSQTAKVPTSASTQTLSNVIQATTVTGSSGPVPNFADGEVPSGTINGSNMAFALALSPNPPSSLILTRNGIVMQRGVDYTLSGLALTFVSAQTPTADGGVPDILQAWYRYSGSSGGSTGSGGTVPNFADGEVPSGTINGSNMAFALAHSPNPPSSLILTRNGVVMQRGVDYTLSGSALTFVSAQTPTADGGVPDILQAWYRY